MQLRSYVDCDGFKISTLEADLVLPRFTKMLLEENIKDSEIMIDGFDGSIVIKLHGATERISGEKIRELLMIDDYRGLDGLFNGIILRGTRFYRNAKKRAAFRLKHRSILARN